MAITKNIIKNNYKSAEIHIRGNSADSSTILLSDIIGDNEVIVSQLQANIQSIKFGTTDTSLIIVSRGSTSIGIFNGSKNVDFSGFGMPLGNTTSINIIFNDNGHLSLTLKKVSGYSEVSSITSIESTVVGLFANGEQGVWYDPSDFSTMFQDTSGTIAVTAVGDPVALIRDKSGNNNHAFQTTSNRRPTLGQDANGYYYLNFDGTSSALATNSINFTSSNSMTLFAGVRKLTDSSTGIICELSTSTAVNIGSFYLSSANANGDNYRVYVYGTSTSGVIQSGISAPSTNTIFSHFTLDQPGLFKMNVNGTEVSSSAPNFGAVNFGNYPLFIGARNNSFIRFTGYLYSLILRGSLTKTGQMGTVEQFNNSKTGAY